MTEWVCDCPICTGRIEEQERTEIICILCAETITDDDIAFSENRPPESIFESGGPEYFVCNSCYERQQGIMS